VQSSGNRNSLFLKNPRKKSGQIFCMTTSLHGNGGSFHVIFGGLNKKNKASDNFYKKKHSLELTLTKPKMENGSTPHILSPRFLKSFPGPSQADITTFITVMQKCLVLQLFGAVFLKFIKNFDLAQNASYLMPILNFRETFCMIK
jgi:hypothetical protein